jgi:hypothetical protein
VRNDILTKIALGAGLDRCIVTMLELAQRQIFEVEEEDK